MRSLSSFFIISLLATFSFPSARAAIYNEVGGIVVVEAEHFDRRVDGPVKKYLIVPDEDPGSQTFSSARGDKFIQVLPDAGENRNANSSVVGTGATVDYKVQINTTGEYQLFMRGVGWDGSADSYYVQIIEISSPAWYRYSPDPATSDFASLRNNNADGSSVIGWNGYATPETNSGDGNERPALYTISKAGVYTIRISQREDGTAIDAFILQRTNLPLPTEPGPPESPTVAAVSKPLSITAVVPSADVTNARFDASIQVIFADGTTKLAANSIVLQLDGVTVTPTVTSDAGTTTAKYQPTSIFKPNTSHTATVSYSDTAGGKFTQTWSFTAANYILIPPTAAVTADRSRSGFLVRTWKSLGQIEAKNRLAWAEEQLAGLHGANEANAAVFTDKQYGNSYFPEEGTINYWNSGGQGGFTNNSEQNTPGLANDGTEDDSYALEAITYLDLPAGALTMGVNCDDGFRVTVFSGGDPRDRSAIVVGQFEGGRANVANNDFPFVLERAGTYPFRLVYLEGEGNSAVEWYMLRTDNTRHLINDANDTVSIKAYRPVAGVPPPPQSKISAIKSDGKAVTIEWTGAATLQAADEIAGPWADVAGAASGKAIAISANRKFYRLKQ